MAPGQEQFDRTGEFESVILDVTIFQVNQLDLLPPIHPSTNFALFLCSLVFAMFWVKQHFNQKIPFLNMLLSAQITYITFFNSRVVGALATNLANRFLHLFVKGGYVKVGCVTGAYTSS